MSSGNRLSDFCQVVDCEHKTAPVAAPGDEFAFSVGTPALRGRSIDFAQAKSVDRQTYEAWSRRAELRRGDIVLAREAPVGGVGYIDGQRKVCLGQRTVLIRVTDDNLDSRFLFFALQSSDVQEWMKDRSTGSTVSHINVADVRELPLTFLPPLAVQRRIAGVLGALDDLIAQEHLSAKQLDDLVHLLGMRFLATLDPGLRAPLAVLASISKGYSYKSAELVPSDTLLVNLKNVGRGGEFQSRGFKPLQATPKAHQYVHNGEILVAQTDLTQDQAVVGRPIRVRRGLLTEKLVASLDLVIVRPTEVTTSEYLFAVLDSSEFRAHALAHCNGTTVVHMAAAALPTFQAPVPDASALADFSDRVRTLRVAADDAVASAERLIRVRDQLLPLLLSGAVTVLEVAR